MSIAEKLQTIAENEQKVYNAGYEKGKSEGGEKPTLFAPTIKLNSVSSELTITDNRNGDFVQGYNVYANDNLVTVSTSKEVTLTDYIEHTETIDIKVQAVSTKFNPSEYAVIRWVKEADGTLGLAYIFSDNMDYAVCSGIGTATDANIVIASEYDGVPVTAIAFNSFRYNSNLISVVIPNSIVTIYTDAFYSCRNLKRVDLSSHTSIPRLYNSTVFYDTHADLQIKVPASLIDQWKTATNWSTYASKIVTEFTN